MDACDTAAEAALASSGGRRTGREGALTLATAWARHAAGYLQPVGDAEPAVDAADPLQAVERIVARLCAQAGGGEPG